MVLKATQSTHRRGAPVHHGAVGEVLRCHHAHVVVSSRLVATALDVGRGHGIIFLADALQRVLPTRSQTSHVHGAAQPTLVVRTRHGVSTHLPAVVGRHVGAGDWWNSRCRRHEGRRWRPGSCNVAATTFRAVSRVFAGCRRRSRRHGLAPASGLVPVVGILALMSLFLFLCQPFPLVLVLFGLFAPLFSDDL